MGRFVHHYILKALSAQLFFFMLSGSVSAGPVSYGSQALEKGYMHYTSSEPEKAVELFDSFLMAFPQSSAADAALFWKAKALTDLGRQNEAVSVYSDLRGRFPDSLFLVFVDRELALLNRPAKASETEAAASARDLLACEARLKDSERLVSERTARMIEVDEALIRLREDHAELSRKSEEMTRQLRGRESELSLLKGRIAAYDMPEVLIGGNEYSMLRIIEESIISTRLLPLLGSSVSTVPWRGGNPYEDFIIEQLLYMKGRAGGIAEDAKAVASMAEKLGLNRAERDYLAKYQVVERFVDAMTSGPAEEGGLREYYDSHRDEFLVHKGGRSVSWLTLHFDSHDEREAARLAAQLQRDAINGKSLENIQASMPDRLILKRALMEDLPPWIASDASAMKEGEVRKSSTEDRFVIMQLQIAEPEYRSYDEARNDIARTLAVDRRKRIAPWLRQLRKEAEEIRYK